MRRPHGHSRRVASKLSRDQRKLVRFIGVPLEGVGPEAPPEPSPAPVVVAGRVSYDRDLDGGVRRLYYDPYTPSTSTFPVAARVSGASRISPGAAAGVTTPAAASASAASWICARPVISSSSCPWKKKMKSAEFIYLDVCSSFCITGWSSKG
jgi:hypothetical protein